MAEISPLALRKGDVLTAKMHRSFPVQEPVYTVGTNTPGVTKSAGFLYVFDILTDPTIKEVFGNKRTDYLAFQVVPRGTATNTKRIFQIPREYHKALGINSYGHKEWDIVLDPAIEMPLLKHPAIPKSFDIDRLDKRGGPSEEIHKMLIEHIQKTFGEKNLFVTRFYFPNEPDRPIEQPTLEEAAADVAKIFEAQVPDQPPATLDREEQDVDVAPDKDITDEQPVIADDATIDTDPEDEVEQAPVVVDKKEPLQTNTPTREEFSRVSYDISLYQIVQRRTGLLRRLESMALVDLRGGADHYQFESHPLKAQSGEILKAEGIQTLREAWEFMQGLSKTGDEQEIIQGLRKIQGITPHGAQELYNAVNDIYHLLDNLRADEEVNNDYLESLVTDEDLIRDGARNGGVTIITHQPNP